MTNFIQSTYVNISRKRSTKRVANAVWEFLQRPEIKNVLAILDFRDFKNFEIYVPGSQSPRIRRINDDFLKRALRSYNKMSIIANGLDSLIKKSEYSLRALVEDVKQEEIDRQKEIRKGFESKGFDVQTQIGSEKVIRDLGQKRNQIIKKLDRSQIEKFHESFKEEVVVREWFVDFLDGLARFEHWIKSGLTTADELKPFLIYWIEVIADRDKRRKGGSSFYDSLFLFIHEAGYKEVIDLFKRYKYDIPKPTYSEVKIEESCLDTKTKWEHATFSIQQLYSSAKSLLDKEYESELDKEYEPDIKRAALLSSAAKLCYEDELYIEDWVLEWTLSFINTYERKDDSSTKTKDDSKSSTSSTKTVLREVIDFLQKEEKSLDILEGKKPYQKLNIEFFKDDETNTFAVAFTLPLKEQKRATIVAFRGTVTFQNGRVNIKNWLTNGNTMLTSPESKDIKGKVHTGFWKSWQKIEKDVFKFVEQQDPHLIFLTGHSLGGAIAVLAAVDFYNNDNYKKKFGGVYTFGQPKVGNPAFAKYFKELKVPMARFVNNSDGVPRIPTLAGVFQYDRNIGKRYYFSAFGKLVLSGHKKLWFVLLRDRIIGLPRFLINLVNGKIILVADHDISQYVKHTQEHLKDNQLKARKR